MQTPEERIEAERAARDVERWEDEKLVLEFLDTLRSATNRFTSLLERGGFLDKAATIRLAESEFETIVTEHAACGQLSKSLSRRSAATAQG